MTSYDTPDTETLLEELFIWADSHPKFNTQFIQSIEDQFRSDSLSEAQIDAVQRIHSRFRVSQWLQKHPNKDTRCR